MKIYKCDRCGKTEPEKAQCTRPEEWVGLSYIISQYESRSDYKDICPECVTILKIPKQINCPEVGERLIEIIEEIVSEAIQNQ